MYELYRRVIALKLWLSRELDETLLEWPMYRVAHK
jgi:hypothetical protein